MAPINTAAVHLNECKADIVRVSLAFGFKKPIQLPWICTEVSQVLFFGCAGVALIGGFRF